MLAEIDGLTEEEVQTLLQAEKNEKNR